MKKYTFKSDGYYAISNDSCFDDQNEDYCGPAIERLAEYEKIGLEPKEIKKALRELKRYQELGTFKELDKALYDATL